MMTHPDSFGARSTLSVRDASHEIFRLDALQSRYDVARLPYTLRVLLENVLAPEDVLVQDAQRVRKSRDVVPGLERVEPEDLVARATDGEGRPGAEAVGVRHHPSIVSLNGTSISFNGTRFPRSINRRRPR